MRKEVILFFLIVAITVACTPRQAEVSEQVEIDQVALQDFQERSQKANLLLKAEELVADNSYHLENMWALRDVMTTHDPAALPYPSRSALYGICSEIMQNTVIDLLGQNCVGRMPQFSYKIIRGDQQSTVKICNEEDGRITVHADIEDEGEVNGKRGRYVSRWDVTLPPRACREMSAFRPELKFAFSDVTYLCDVPRFNEKQKLVPQYFVLQCMNGNAIYEDSSSAMLQQAKEQPEEIDFVTENMVSFKDIFPLNVIVPDFELGKSEIDLAKKWGNWCGDQVCDWDEDARWCQDCGYTGEVRQKEIERFKNLPEDLRELNIAALYRETIIVPKSRGYYGCLSSKPVKDERGYTSSNIGYCKDYLEKLEAIKVTDKEFMEQEGVKTVVSKQESGVVVEEQRPQEKTYDFPFLKMDEGDIIAKANYHPIAKEILSDYNAIGVVIDDKEHTVLIMDGIIVDIVDGLQSDLDFKVTTTETAIISLTNQARNGDRADALWGAIKLLPPSVYLRVVPKINVILKNI